eukprot:41656_1
MVSEGKRRISIDRLAILVRTSLKNHGFSPSEIPLISDVLLYAQLRGNNQGVIKLVGPDFAKDPNCQEPKIERETISTCLIDAGQTQAMLVAAKAIDIAAQKAKETGVAFVGVHNHCSSTGAIGFWVRKLAARGFVGLMFAGNIPLVSPHGAREALFGTNPVAFGIPTEGDPLVFDMSSSAISYFGVIEANLSGRPIPSGVALDRCGRDTTDPAAVLDGGSLRPFDRSYKGSHLAMMVEVLAGPLIRAQFAGLNGPKNWGFAFIAIDPVALGGSLDVFRAGVTRLTEKVRSVTPIDPSFPVRLPGESGDARAKRAQREGFIDIDSNLLSGLEKSANQKVPAKL